MKSPAIPNLLGCTRNLILAVTACGQQTHRELLDHGVDKRTMGDRDESILQLNAKLTAIYLRCDYGA